MQNAKSEYVGGFSREMLHLAAVNQNKDLFLPDS